MSLSQPSGSGTPRSQPVTVPVCTSGTTRVRNDHFLPCIYTNQFRFLDKAMVIDDLDASSETRNPWRLFTKSSGTNLLHQTRKLNDPINRLISDSPSFPPNLCWPLTIIVFIPIYDRIFVPIARKFTGHHSGITMLQRIGTGLLISVIIMIVAAMVEARRLKIIRDHNLMDNPKAIVPMRVWWLVPQYVISGLSDVFAFVGIQELFEFYDQMPEAMRSLGAAFYLSVTGVGNFISSGIITLVQIISSKYGEKWISDNINRGHLDYFYWLSSDRRSYYYCSTSCLEPESFVNYFLSEVLRFEHYKCFLASEERKGLRGTSLASSFLQLQGMRCNKQGRFPIGDGEVGTRAKAVAAHSAIISSKNTALATLDMVINLTKFEI
ncbi:hypothetical protein ACLB2K_072763 [Fragaria x ananassa]